MSNTGDKTFCFDVIRFDGFTQVAITSEEYLDEHGGHLNEQLQIDDIQEVHPSFEAWEVMEATFEVKGMEEASVDEVREYLEDLGLVYAGDRMVVPM